MSPTCALNRSQARRRQGVDSRVHSDVRVKQEVHAFGCNLFARGRQSPGKVNVRFASLLQELGDVVLLRRKREDMNLKPAAVETRNQAAPKYPDRMII